MATQTVQIRRGNLRGKADLGWLKARHSFSFGQYYDPSNIRFATLRVLNEDVIAPGGGFPEHGHDNMEILTWVLEGALEHSDNLGHKQLLQPGELQVMSAGTGIRHSEFNASQTEPVHLLQIWMMPADRDTEPRYEQKMFDAENRLNQWDTLAAGRAGAGPLIIGQDAELKVVDLEAGHVITASVATGREGYLHMAKGQASLAGTPLAAGDAATFSSNDEVTLAASEDSQFLLFDLG